MTAEAESVVVRAMGAADLPRVIEIAESLREAPHWPMSSYAAAIGLESPPRIALVAESNHGVAGFCIAVQIPPQAELEVIAVATSQQRRGVGRALLTGLIERLKLRGIAELMLEVRRSNLPALALYGSSGFLESGRRPSYYADPIEDAVLLKLSL